MKHIAEKTDSEGRLYYKAIGFLDGKSYRGITTRNHHRSDVLKIMTCNPNARHPGDWERREVGAAALALASAHLKRA
jgi:hypothetical protein